MSKKKRAQTIVYDETVDFMVELLDENKEAFHEVSEAVWRFMKTRDEDLVSTLENSYQRMFFRVVISQFQRGYEKYEETCTNRSNGKKRKKADGQPDEEPDEEPDGQTDRITRAEPEPIAHPARPQTGFSFEECQAEFEKLKRAGKATDSDFDAVKEFYKANELLGWKFVGDDGKEHISRLSFLAGWIESGRKRQKRKEATKEVTAQKYTQTPYTKEDGEKALRDAHDWMRKAIAEEDKKQSN